MRKRLILFVSLFSMLVSIGSWSQILGKGHAEAEAVRKALTQADLKDVTVSDDTDKNTITLGGTVHSEEAKARAGEVAKSVASNRIIANEVSVRPVGSESQARAIASNLDDGIEDNYKAALISKGLDKQSIHYKAKNGVLVLSGSVKTPGQREQAQQLASRVPNVRQVVNQVEIHP